MMTEQQRKDRRHDRVAFVFVIGLTVSITAFFLLIIALLTHAVAPTEARAAVLPGDCRMIVRRFHGSWGNLYDYVWSFPKEQQKQVLACLGCPANTVASWPERCFNHGG